jgi:TolA-binding protein
MKKLFLATLAVAIFMGCDNPVSKKIKETKEKVSNTHSAVQELNNMQEDMKELQEEEPLTNEELKAWLPDEVNGMKRVSYKAGQMGMVQISSVEAMYENEDKSKKFKVEVIDGAGQMGAAATAAMRMMFSQDFEEESEYKTRRTVTKKGVKAIEEHRKNNNNSIIEFMKDKRFYIKATGNNMDLDETWKAIDELDAGDLG